MKQLLTIVLMGIAMITLAQEPLYVGGDISLLPKYEEAGVVYKDKEGQTVSDVLAFFRQQGQNAMRVRLFVSPDGSDKAVCQDLDYVKALGKRIKDA